MKPLAQLAQECGFDVDENATISSVGNMNVRLHAFRAACRAEALEEAAQLCDTIEGGRYPDGQVCAGFACECAAAIREMK